MRIMPPSKIHSIRTQLTTEYFEPKKQASQQATTVVPKKPARPDVLPEDIVTISSRRSDDQIPPARLKPSQPVSIEEKQALRSGFSIHA